MNTTNLLSSKKARTRVLIKGTSNSLYLLIYASKTTHLIRATFKLNIFTINKTFIQIYTVNHATFGKGNISQHTSHNRLFLFFFLLLSNARHVYCTDHFETEEYG